MGVRSRHGRAAWADAAQGRDTVMREGCALCGHADRPPALSLTTTTPPRPGGLRVVAACHNCAARTTPYATLVAALLHAAVAEAPAPPPATVTPQQ